MFYTYKASNVYDKVYTLLSISSNSLKEASLRPNYKVSQKELFQQLVKFVLGKNVSVETFKETSNNSQRAVIKSKGSILGQVSLVRSDNRQNVIITSKNAAQHLGDKMKQTL